MDPIAVLTGDIVNSGDLDASELGTAMAALQNDVRQMPDWPRVRASGFARRAGDGWQAALTPPCFALRAALSLRSSIRQEGKHLETRISIALGQGTPPFSDLNSAVTPVFIASGRALEALPRDCLMSVYGGGTLDATARLLDHISRGWTPAQAAAVHAALHAPDAPVRVLAQTLGKSRQAVDQALHAAGYPAINAALTLIEEVQDAS